MTGEYDPNYHFIITLSTSGQACVGTNDYASLVLDRCMQLKHNIKFSSKNEYKFKLSRTN